MSARLFTPTLITLLIALPALAQDREIPMAERGYMGIQPAQLGDEVRAHFKIDQSITKGLVLTQIFDGTAAAKAGLRAGDVLTGIDNKPVNSVQNLMQILATKRPGAKLAYVARRGTGTIAGLLVLGKRPVESREVAEPREVIEAPKVIRPGKVLVTIDTPPTGGAKPKSSEPNLDRRMDKLSAEIEVLRKRALERKARAERDARKQRAAKRKAGGGLKNGLGNWIERERKALETATHQRNERKIGWHRARLSVLEEMAAASGKRGERGGAEQRMMRVEKRLLDVMERIEQLERQLRRERKRK